MLGFHIDMNVARYRVDYLSEWLSELGRLGYDSILWDIGGSVAWETCPECAGPDALSKGDMRALVTECRLHGLEPIPLLNTLDHANYVLRHEKYGHLRENPGSSSQYCLRNAKTAPFLIEWIDEHLELFRDVKYFHIGAGDTICTPRCQACTSYVHEHSLASLFLDHVHACTKPLVRRHVSPVIWGDVVLASDEVLERLPRQITLFDRCFDSYRGRPDIRLPPRDLEAGRPLQDRWAASADLTAEERRVFGPFIFPEGDERGVPEAFHTSDYMASHGFHVVTCSSACHRGDSVFAPRSSLHAENVFDSTNKGFGPQLAGTLLTSWSTHLVPWELQHPSMAIPAFLNKRPGGTIEEFRDWYTRRKFGAKRPEFWHACELLSGTCLFSTPETLGFDGDCLPVSEWLVPDTLRRLRDAGGLEEELATCERRKKEYAEALRIIRKLEVRIMRGQGVMQAWKRAARGLELRAQASSVLLRASEAVIAGTPGDVHAAQRARIVLGRSRALRREVSEHYVRMLPDSHTSRIVGYLFGPVEAALARLVVT